MQPYHFTYYSNPLDQAVYFLVAGLILLLIFAPFSKPKTKRTHYVSPRTSLHRETNYTHYNNYTYYNNYQITVQPPEAKPLPSLDPGTMTTLLKETPKPQRDLLLAMLQQLDQQEPDASEPRQLSYHRYDT
jgi:hypothetical protein